MATIIDLATKVTYNLDVFKKSQVKIGRDEENDLSFPDATVSREHFTLEDRQGEWGLISSITVNPPYIFYLDHAHKQAALNCKPDVFYHLRDGDYICFGKQTLEFRL